MICPDCESDVITTGTLPSGVKVWHCHDCGQLQPIEGDFGVVGAEVSLAMSLPDDEAELRQLASDLGAQVFDCMEDEDGERIADTIVAMAEEVIRLRAARRGER
jgi:NMD protein affecting ribosome stability and mRNA decay